MQRISISIILGLFYVLMLTTCAVNKLNKNDFCCSINKVDNLKNFNAFNKDLSPLKIPKNLNITLPSINTDYAIPIIDIPVFYDNTTKIGICPPEMFEDILGKSCVIKTN